MSLSDKQKIKLLEKEISELEKKKQDKDKVKELLRKRNELKFVKLYAAGDTLKRFGSGIAKWADEKNKQIAEDLKKEAEEEKKSKKKKKEPDLYDSMFGTEDILGLDNLKI